MPMQKQSYQIVGMKQDNLVGTGFSTKFAHEIKNMRLNTVDDYTTGVWTTEKGTKLLDNISIKQIDNIINSKLPKQNGTLDLSSLIVLGHATINNQWVIFGFLTTSNAVETNCILRLFYDNNEPYCEPLYLGNLNFSKEHPIETLPYYENDFIQKVYFTDGYNQPRVINIKNIKRRYIETSQNQIDLTTLETQFDFVREVSLNENVTITKLQSGNGMFPPCTVKYAITYYDKYSQETNIVYTSPLYYPINGSRGCSPDELSGDSFEITVRNIDLSFDYIRLYSIVRTSEDATPIVRIVADKLTSEAYVDSGSSQSAQRRVYYVKFIDTNTTGEIIDPNILHFVGGRNITAQTFDQKTNTLFLGNLELKTKSVTGVFPDDYNPGITWELHKDRYFRANATYPYNNQLSECVNNDNNIDNTHVSSQDIKHFKAREEYWFGLQFQDKYGVWSEVVSNENFKTINPEDYLVHHSDNWRTHIRFACPKLELDDTKVNSLISEGYKKARLVCAKKDNSTRKVIAQGIVDSTLYEKSTENNDPYRYASWFFRPKEFYFNNKFGDKDSEHPEPLGYFTFGRIYDESYNIGAGTVYNSTDLNQKNIDNYDLEVQNEGRVRKDGGSNASIQPTPKWIVDREWMSFHSPEIELDDSLRTILYNNLSCNIIGFIPINKTSTNYLISGSAPELDNGFFQSLEHFNFDNGYPTYNLKVHKNCNKQLHYKYDDKQYRSDLYPFQSYIGSNIGWDYKVFSSLLISDTPFLASNIDDEYTLYNCIKNNKNYLYKLKNPDNWKNLRKTSLIVGEFKIFNEETTDYITLPKDPNNVSNSDSKLYCGSCRMIAPYVQEYPVFGLADSSGNTLEFKNDPISFTYKTTTHGVFKSQLNIKTYEESNSIIQWEEYKQNGSNYERTNRDVNEYRPYLWLVDITRTNQIVSEDVKNLIFTPCSPAQNLVYNTPLTLYGLEGDHYLMRYDCLKTYPAATTDRNQIVEILSFLCETRINIDGRYDNKRGLLDNTTVLNTNFNLINKSYTQDNDFFSYTTLDKLSSELDSFTNQITYTPVKVSGEDIDAWTNITLANVDNADGSCGKINKIININDKLFLFQDYGIARINYDEKTTLTTDSGVPIELNSSGKYTGIDYISKNVGCQNKWSISSTKNGLFWIDDSRRELLTLDENMTSVTTLNGFDSFMINNCNTKQSWNPDSFNNFITHYDKLSKDIYFINNVTCLTWNEISKTFTSFYDYDNVSALTTLYDHTLMFRNTGNNGAIYAAREGDKYSHFFNSDKPYWITLVCDGSSAQNNNFSLDKVFDTIEYRADIFNADYDISDNSHIDYNTPIFNIKHVWNGYQDSDECALDGIRKFNTWRVQLPRHKGTRDRIRNPFCYIKLLQNQSEEDKQTSRAILHDLAVSYSIK